MDAVSERAASIRCLGSRTSPGRRPRRLGPDRGGFDRLDGFGTPGRRHDAARALYVKQDALEPSLVVGPTGLVVRVPVDAPAIDDQLGKGADQLLMFEARGGELDQPGLGLLELHGEVSLLGSGNVDRNDLFHRLLGPLNALALDGADALPQPPLLRLRGGGVVGQIGQQRLPQLVGERCRQALTLPLVDDVRLDSFLGKFRQLTAIFEIVAAVAKPVAVASAGLAGRSAVDETRAAAGADSRAWEQSWQSTLWRLQNRTWPS